MSKKGMDKSFGDSASAAVDELERTAGIFAKIAGFGPVAVAGYIKHTSEAEMSEKIDALLESGDLDYLDAVAQLFKDPQTLWQVNNMGLLRQVVEWVDRLPVAQKGELLSGDDYSMVLGELGYGHVNDKWLVEVNAADIVDDIEEGIAIA